jgi:hypothetical protein
LLSGGHVSGIPETSAKVVDTLRGQLTSEKGLGEPIISTFLNGIPGINRSIYEDAFAGHSSITIPCRDKEEADRFYVAFGDGKLQ